MNISDEEKKRLQSSVERNIGPLKSSKIMLTVFSDGGIDVVQALQIGMCVLLDKPLYLLAHKGVKISEHLRKLAENIVEVDFQEDGAVAKGTEELLRSVKEFKI